MLQPETRIRSTSTIDGNTSSRYCHIWPHLFCALTTLWNRMILLYLVPIKLVLGKQPSEQLLQKYNLQEVTLVEGVDIARCLICMPQYVGMSKAIRQGNFKEFNEVQAGFFCAADVVPDPPLCSAWPSSNRRMCKVGCIWSWKKPKLLHSAICSKKCT